MSTVIWHDLECGRYAADLPLWRELACAHGAPGILDVGAGTGRVALDLAAHGHAVTALDHDPALLAALSERATTRRLSVRIEQGDAQAFDLEGAAFGLVLVPMQTLQLLSDRAGFLRAARRHVRPGAILAAALADALEGFDPSSGLLPAPDETVHEGWRYASQPVAVREGPAAATIERIRTVQAPDGSRSSRPDSIALARVSAAGLAAEAAALGWEGLPPRRVEATQEHVGSEVAVLRAR